MIWLAALANGLAGTATAQQTPVLPASAAAQIIAVQYTGLKPPACTTTHKSRPEQIGEHEVVRWRCPAPGGRIVTLDYHGVYVTLGLSSRRERVGQRLQGKRVAGEGLVAASYDIGPRMEWRGSGSGKDSGKDFGKGKGFTPHAAIVRLHARNDAGIIVSVLAVLQIAGNSICVAAIADGADANALARTHADRFANTPQAAPACPPAPELLGPGGPVARAMQDGNAREQVRFLQEFNARKAQER